MKPVGTLVLGVVVLAVATSSTAQAEEPGPYSLAEATWAKALVAGPDGNVWFLAESEAESADSEKIILGKVTTAGEVTEVPLPVLAPRRMRYRRAETIVAGADGNLWFGERNAVGRSTTTGEVDLVRAAGGRECPDRDGRRARREHLVHRGRGEQDRADYS
jgi:streptogramin lyase